MFTELLSTNSKNRQVTGVQNFHDAGYYGERVHAASLECWSMDRYNPDGLCDNPLNYNSATTHGMHTAACFFQVAPKAHLSMFYSAGRFKSDGTYESKIMSDALPYAKEHGITAMFASLSLAGNTNFRKDYGDELINMPDFCPCWAAGNDGEGSYGRMLEIDGVFGVGGFTTVNGKVEVIGHSGSSYTDYVVDFCAPFDVHYQITKGMDGLCSGTSAATPWLCGMICLVNDFFIDKTGKPLTREKMMQFLKDYSKDIEEEGQDTRSGWGVPCLPKPSEIDVAKYATVDEPEESEPDVNPNPDPEPTPEPEPEPEDPKPTYPGVSDWALEAWDKAAQNGIIDGTRPTDNITRQEAVVILDRCGLLD